MTEDNQQDEVLSLCNETELLELARRQKLGRIKMGLPRDELIQLVRGAVDLQPHHLSETTATRGVLEDFIVQNWGRLQSQLPGCTGKCRTFDCTEGKHALCFYPNKALLQ